MMQAINIPNLLTLLRILLIPVLVLLFYLPFHGHFTVTAVVFILASLTDWLDGYLARRLNQGTAFGAFLDPVADKLTVVVVLVLLVEHFAAGWLTIAAIIIVGREVVVSALREWMAELGKRTSVAVSYIGKVKTVLQMIAIASLLLAAPNPSGWFTYLAGLVLVISALLTLWSMVVYLRAAWLVVGKRL